MRSCLVCTQGNMNSNRYIREVLELEVFSLRQAIIHSIFQEDNAQYAILFPMYSGQSEQQPLH